MKASFNINQIYYYKGQGDVFSEKNVPFKK